MNCFLLEKKRNDSRLRNSVDTVENIRLYQMKVAIACGPQVRIMLRVCV